MCKLWEATPSVDMSYKELIRVLPDLKSFGIKYITLLGGEPLLYKDLFKLAGEIKKRFTSCSIVTNGSLVNEKNISEIKKYFDYVEISLDANNDDIFSRIRRGYSFNKVINAIGLLSRYKIPHGVTFLVQKDNVGRIERTHKLAQSLKTPMQLSFIRTTKHGVTENNDFGVVDPDLFKSEFGKIRSSEYLTTKEESFDLLLDRLSGKKRNWKCLSSFFNLPIYPDGTIYPCDGIDRPMGNIFKESLEKIYSTPDFKALRKRIIGHKSGECSRCMHLCAINSSLNYDFSIPGLAKRAVSRLKRDYLG